MKISTNSKKALTLAIAYNIELDRQDAKGSTGSRGKAREVTFRLDNNRYIDTDDFKARSAKRNDACITINGKRYNVEVKSNFGCQWAYGTTEEQAWRELKKLEKKLIVVDLFRDDNLVAFKGSEFLAYLATYSNCHKQGLEAWFDFKAPTAKRGGQLQAQPVMAGGKILSKVKVNFLKGMAEAIGRDWETVRETNTWD